MCGAVRFCNHGKADSWLINIQNIEACDRKYFILNWGDLFLSSSTVMSLIIQNNQCSVIRVYFVIHFLETRKKLLLWTIHTYRTQCPYFSEELLSTEEIKKRSLFLLLSCKSDHCHYTPSLPCLHFVLILLWKNSYSSLFSFIFTQETTEEETNFILLYRSHL